jgi:hypothetical protein
MSSIRTFELNKNQDFISIRHHVFDALFKRIGISSLGELDELDPNYIASLDLDLRYDMNLMSTIDTHLRSIILLYIGPVKFVQFPVNIRIASPLVAHDSYSRPYSTDYLHCDCWSQAPSDSSNIFLYLHYTQGSPKLDFYNVADIDLQTVLSYKGPYKFAPHLNVQKSNQITSTGTMYDFPTHTLHKTNRGTKGFRISLDVRYRPLSDNFKDSQLFDALLRDDWLVNRMTSLGVYWLFYDKSCESFYQRISEEIYNSVSMGKEYTYKRLAYIKRFYPTFI